MRRLLAAMGAAEEAVASAAVAVPALFVGGTPDPALSLFSLLSSLSTLRATTSFGCVI
jgi:hypothetical protein